MIPRYTPIRKRRPGRRRGPARDAKYLGWIRRLPCWITGACEYPVEAAHIGPHGMSQKASDYSTVPLCHAHHRALHIFGRAAFDAEYGTNLMETAERLYEEYQRWRAA